MSNQSVSGKPFTTRQRIALPDCLTPHLQTSMSVKANSSGEIVPSKLRSVGMGKQDSVLGLPKLEKPDKNGCLNFIFHTAGNRQIVLLGMTKVEIEAFWTKCFLKFRICQTAVFPAHNPQARHTRRHS